MHTEHQLKSKLRWPKCPKSTKLKLKWNRSNDCSWKWCFYWVITWKLLFRGGINLWWQKSTRGGIFLGGWEWADFQLVGGGGSPSPSRENPAFYWKFPFILILVFENVIHSPVNLQLEYYDFNPLSGYYFWEDSRVPGIDRAGDQSLPERVVKPQHIK